MYNKYNTNDDKSDNTQNNNIYFTIKKENGKPSFLELFINFLNRGDIINTFSIPEEISNLFKMFTTYFNENFKFKYKYEFVLCNEYDYTSPSPSASPSASPSPSSSASPSPPPSFSMIKELRINQYYEEAPSVIKSLKDSENLLKDTKNIIEKSEHNLDYIIQLNLNLDFFEISNYSRFDNTLLKGKSPGSTSTKLKELENKKKPIITRKIEEIYKKEIVKSAFTNYEMITKIKNTN